MADEPGRVRTPVFLQTGGTCYLMAAATLVQRALSYLVGFDIPSMSDLMERMARGRFKAKYGRDGTAEEVREHADRGGFIVECVQHCGYDFVKHRRLVGRKGLEDAARICASGRPVGISLTTQHWELFGGTFGKKAGHCMVLTQLMAKEDGMYASMCNSWGANKSVDGGTGAVTRKWSELVDKCSDIQLFHVFASDDDLRKGGIASHNNASLAHSRYVEAVLAGCRPVANSSSGQFVCKPTGWLPAQKEFMHMQLVLLTAKDWCKSTGVCHSNIVDVSREPAPRSSMPMYLLCFVLVAVALVVLAFVIVGWKAPRSRLDVGHLQSLAGAAAAKCASRQAGPRR